LQPSRWRPCCPRREAFAAPAQAACEKQTNNTYEKVLECVLALPRRRNPA
jgi:hypothetical protein